MPEKDSVKYLQDYQTLNGGLPSKERDSVKFLQTRNFQVPSKEREFLKFPQTAQKLDVQIFLIEKDSLKYLVDG